MQQLLNRVCAALRGPLTFPWPDPAPDSIIGILIFKYPPTNNRPLIQLNFFCHILQEGQRKYFPQWKVQTHRMLAPTDFYLASFAKTAPRKRIQERFELRLEALTGMSPIVSTSDSQLVSRHVGGRKYTQERGKYTQRVQNISANGNVHI